MKKIQEEIIKEYEYWDNVVETEEPDTSDLKFEDLIGEEYFK